MHGRHAAHLIEADVVLRGEAQRERLRLKVREAARLGLVLSVEPIGGKAGAADRDDLALYDAAHRLVRQDACELASRATEGRALRLRGLVRLGLGVRVRLGFG